MLLGRIPSIPAQEFRVWEWKSELNCSIYWIEKSYTYKEKFQVHAIILNFLKKARKKKRGVIYGTI
jgi:hypothetical protein